MLELKPVTIETRAYIYRNISGSIIQYNGSLLMCIIPITYINI